MLEEQHTSMNTVATNAVFKELTSPNEMEQMYGSPINSPMRPNSPISGIQPSEQDEVSTRLVRGLSAMNDWPISAKNSPSLAIKESSSNLNNGMESVYGSPINSQKITPFPTKTVNSPITLPTQLPDDLPSTSYSFYLSAKFRRLSTFFQKPLERMFGSPTSSTKIQPANKIIPTNNDAHLSDVPNNVTDDVSEYPIISRPESRKKSHFINLSELFQKPNLINNSNNSNKYHSNTP